MVGEILVGINMKWLGLTQGIAGMSSLDLETRRAAVSMAALKGEINGVEAGMHRQLIKQDALIGRAYKMRAAFAGVAALAGGALIGASINDAAHFQLAMTAAYASTRGMTPALKQQMAAEALHMSTVTAQSAVTMAQEMAIAAQTGLGAQGGPKLMGLYERLAKFADVQQFMAQGRGSGFSPQEAISYGVQFSHMLGAYTPDKMNNMLQYMTAFLTVQSESPMRALRQAKYFVPLGKALGMNEEQIFELLSVMGTSGFLQGRGGSGMGRVLLGAINSPTLTGHAKKEQLKDLIELGVLDSSGRNQMLMVDRRKGSETYGQTVLDYEKFAATMSSARDRLGPVAYANDMKGAFGLIAAQWMNVLETPWTKQQMGLIHKQFQEMFGRKGGPIGYLFDLLMNNFLPQLQRLMTTISVIGTEIFLPLLPSMTVGLKFFADWLGRFAELLGKNPLFAGYLGISTIVAVAGASLYAVSQLVLLQGALERLAVQAAVTAGATGAGGTGGMIARFGPWAGLISLLSRLAIGFGIFTVISATLGMIYGILHEDYMDRKYPKHGKMDAWASGGANRGLPAPAGSFPTEVDMFGRTVYDMHKNKGAAQFQHQRNDFARVVKQHFATPVVNALLGSTGTSLSDVFVTHSQKSADRIIDALKELPMAIRESLGNVGIQIQIPGPDGKMRTITQKLTQTGKVVTGGSGAGKPLTTGPWGLNGVGFKVQ